MRPDRSHFTRAARCIGLLALLLGLPALQAPHTAAQGAATPFPGLHHAYTLGSADGGVDGIRFVFNGTVDARHAYPGHFGIQGCACAASARMDETLEYTDHFTIRFQPRMPTSWAPMVWYNATGAGDDSGPPLRTPEDSQYLFSSSGPWSVQVRDKVPPGIRDAVTQDLDHDGLIDAYRVNFTEAVDDAHFVYTEWHVAGTQTQPITTCDPYSLAQPTDPCPAATRNDGQVFVRFQPRAYLDTGSLPQLTYEQFGGNGLRDTYLPRPDLLPGDAPNELQDIGTSRVFERDGSPGRLVRVVAAAGSTHAYAIFSEWVQTAAGGNPLPATFSYADGAAGGAHALQAVASRPGSGIVRLTLDNAAAAADLGADTLTISGTALKDAAGNPIAAATLPLQGDTAAPAAVPVSVTDLGTTQATVRWNAPADVDFDHAEVRLLAQGSGQTAWSAMARVGNVTGAPSAAQSIALTGLTPFRSYEVAVRPVDLMGNVAPDTHATFTTLATASAPANGTPGGAGGSPPGTATPRIPDLHAMPGGQASQWFAFSWTAPSAHGSAVAGYEVRYGTTLENATFSTGLAGEAPAPLPPGATQSAWITGLAPSTSYVLGVRTVDGTGAAGPPSFLPFTTLNGTVAPRGPLNLTSPTHPSGTAKHSGNVTLRWTNATGEGTIVYRLAVDGSPRNVTLPDLAAVSPMNVTLPEGTHVLRVAAFGPGGRIQSEPYTVTVDQTPPGPVANATAAPRPAGLHLAADLPADAGSGAGLAVRYRLGAWPADSDWDSFGNETRTPPATDLLRLQPNATYTVALRAVDQAGLPGPITVLNATTLPDTTPPQGTLAPHVDGSLADGTAPMSSVALLWSAAADGETAVQYRYAMSDEPRDLAADDPTTASPEARFDGMAEGEHVFLVRAESAGGPSATETIGFRVRLVAVHDVGPANQAVNLTVERVDGANHLSWTLPPLDPAPAGVQVWYGNSPYQLLADVPGTAPGSFVHEGDAAKSTTRYAVTVYYAKSAELGWYDEAMQPTAQSVKGIQLQQAGLLAWVPSSWPMAAAAGGALAVAVLALVAWRRRSSAPRGLAGAQDTDATETALEHLANPLAAGANPGASADALAVPVSAEAFEVSCFHCPEVYTATGMRPLETVCPACGSRGLIG